MNADPLAPLMFAVLFLLLFVGYPVAFVLGGVALVFGVLALWADAVTEAYLLLLPERVFGIMANQVLLAIPFFVGLTP